MKTEDKLIKKLKPKFRYQKNPVKVEEKYLQKTKNKTLDQSILLDKFICLQMLPMLSGAMQTIRKLLEDRGLDMTKVPGSYPMACAIAQNLEGLVEEFSNEIKCLKKD